MGSDVEKTRTGSFCVLLYFAVVGQQIFKGVCCLSCCCCCSMYASLCYAVVRQLISKEVCFFSRVFVFLCMLHCMVQFFVN